MTVGKMVDDLANCPTLGPVRRVKLCFRETGHGLSQKGRSVGNPAYHLLALVLCDGWLRPKRPNWISEIVHGVLSGEIKKIPVEFRFSCPSAFLVKPLRR